MDVDIYDYKAWEDAAAWMRLTGDDSDLRKLERAYAEYFRKSKDYDDQGKWITRELKG